MNWKNWTGSATFWKTLPTSSFLIFLAAVFCLFASLGFILDSRNPPETGASELALNVLVRSLFAVCWAFLGVRRMFKSMIRNCGWANVRTLDPKDISNQLRARVLAHGEQRDDQTILLIRRVC